MVRVGLDGVVWVPLSEVVSFKALLQKRNRVQVPRLVRWRYRLESDEVWRIYVGFDGGCVSESFFGRMLPDGRITVPKLVVELIEKGQMETPTRVVEVTLHPTTGQGHESMASREHRESGKQETDFSKGAEELLRDMKRFARGK